MKDLDVLEDIGIFVRVDDGKLRRKILRALVVDDDRGYRGNAREHLEALGFAVDEAKTLDEAEEMAAANSYKFVVMDNIYNDLDQPRGSSFLSRRLDRFAGADVFLVTGFARNQIEESDHLMSSGVKILEKGIDHFDELSEEAKLTASRQMDIFEKGLLDGLNMIGGGRERSSVNVLGQRLAERAMSYLKAYLLSFPNQDEAQFAIGSVVYSPADLLDELDDGSSIGEELLDMFLEDTLGD